MKSAQNNPICPHCESVALRDTGYTKNKIAQCPRCGYRGKMDTTLEQYTKKRLYR